MLGVVHVFCCADHKSVGVMMNKKSQSNSAEDRKYLVKGAGTLKAFLANAQEVWHNENPGQGNEWVGLLKWTKYSALFRMLN